jgi:hypothetical protein
MLREKMKEVLKDNVCEVQFTKVDGTLRTMRCTLMQDSLPPLKTDGKQHPENLDIIPVWDVEAEGWRSFRLDSVKSFGTVSSNMEDGSIVELLELG